MIHLIVKNKPSALKETILTHKIDCKAFRYDANKRKILIYDNLIEYVNDIPSFGIVNVVEIITY